MCIFGEFNTVIDPQIKAPPRVWVIGAYRAGEQSQLLALAEALGWPYEYKNIVHRRRGALFNLFRGSGLFAIDRQRSCALEPPWPELTIAAGMRNEPLCRWIRQASGGYTRIVHIGRPWANPQQFDLVITTPQYRIAPHPKVLQNTLTLHRVNRANLERSLIDHAPRLARTPRPHIALIVGGDSGPYAFGAGAARRLARQVSAMARELGAGVLVSGSSRTPEAVLDILDAQIEAPHDIYRWRAQDSANPYYAFLASAERIVVSFDSISMLSEACATARPVFMFDLERDHGAAAEVVEPDRSIRSLGYQALMRFGPRRLGRDIGLVHEELIRSGRAVWLGEKFPAAPTLQTSDIERAVQRVRALLNRDQLLS